MRWSCLSVQLCSGCENKSVLLVHSVPAEGRNVDGGFTLNKHGDPCGPSRACHGLACVEVFKDGLVRGYSQTDMR